MTTSHQHEFIAEMKEKLLAEKQLLERELDDIAEPSGNDYRAKFPEYGEHEDENAIEIADYQATVATTEADKERLESVVAALERIERGEYGVTDSGELIPEDRLRANPAAATLVT